MTRLAISLLGGFKVSQDGLTLHAFESDKCRALLAYLAVEKEHPQRRESLAFLFWPNHPEAAARANLRQTLHRLRRTIGDIDNSTPHLRVSSQEIQYNSMSDSFLDAGAFYQMIASYQEHHAPGSWPCQDCLQHLEQAARLYRGDFLAGFSLPDASQFQWWLLYKQEEYHRLAMQALTELASYYEACQNYTTAIKYAKRKIALEPWYEPAHRRCMRLLVLSGQRGAALRQYEVCQEILAVEMGIQPSPLTRQLYEQILMGEWEKWEIPVLE